MISLKEFEFNTLKEIFICTKAIIAQIDNEYLKNGKLYFGISRSNILINPDDITNIKLIEQPSLTIGFDEVPKQCLEPWAATELKLYIRGNKKYYSTETAVQTIIGTIGNLAFYLIMNRCVDVLNLENCNFSEYNFDDCDERLKNDMSEIVCLKLTELFHRTVVCDPKLRYSHCDEYNSALDDIIAIL